MDDLTKHLIKKCALRNDELREGLPVNYITHEVVSLKSNNNVYRKNNSYRFNAYNGSLILSHKIFICSQVHSILKDVKKFTDFNDNNNPFGERCFGDLHYQNLEYGNVGMNFKGWRESDQTIFFKIEYWQDSEMAYKVNNHLKGKCFRSLTIYEASEY